MPQYASTAEDWQEKLRQDAPVGWRQLKKVSTRLEGTLTWRRTVADRRRADASFSKETDITFKVRDTCFCGLTSKARWLSGAPLKSDDGVAKGAACVNSKYAFIVTQNEGRDAWVSQHVSPYRTQKMESLAQRDWVPYLWASWQIFGADYEEVFQKPAFKVQAVTLDSTQPPQVTVKFSYSPSEAEARDRNMEQPFWVLRGGTLTFLPHQHWSLKRSELVVRPTDQEVIETTVIEYGDAIDGCPMPKEVRRSFTDANYMEENLATIKRISAREIPDHEFSLAAFGLPEPDFVKGRPTPARWWLWGALAGGALLVVGVIVGWLRQRVRR